MKSSTLSASRTPFIRLLIPLLVGIGCGEYLSWPGWIAILSALGGIILWSISLKRDSIEEQLRKRHYWGWGLFLLLFSLGLGLYQWQHRPIELPKHHYPTAIARIEQKAIEKRNTYYCEATIEALCDSNGASVTYKMPIALYLGKSLYANRLRRGDLVAIPFTPKPIQGGSNPDEMDYVRFMKHRGIEYSQYLQDNQWRYLGKDTDDLQGRVAQWQEQLIRQLYRCHLSPQSTAILKAMLLGEQQELSPELRQTFSAAGISHILAVSGLHTGIVAMLIYGLLYPLTLSASTRRCRPIIALLILWLYCFITGLSPSAVRATIMASFILVAEAIERRNSSLNALFAAAFFMLLYDTNLLFHVGFQLSFTAVASILLFYSRLNVWGNSRYRIVRWLSSTLAVSIAAQIGTLPIAIYYFHTLPLLFLLGNLVVLPLLPIIFGGGFLLLLLSALNWPIDWLKSSIDFLLHFIEKVSVWIYHLPGSHLDGVWLESRYLWAYLVGGILLYIAFKNRSKQMLWITLVAGIAFLIADLYSTKPGDPEFIVYDDNKATVIQLSEGKSACLILPDTLTTERIVGENHRWRNGQRTPLLVYPGSPGLQQENTFISYPFARFYSQTLLLLDSTNWCNRTAGHTIPVDHAIIDKQFQGKIKELLPLFSIHHIIIAANVHPTRANNLTQECYQLGIPCHNIRAQGVWIKTVE